MFHLLTKRMLTNKRSYIFAFIVYLCTSVVFMFPAFMGKVDTPIDIRDIRMYPWRYYAIDKKIKKIILWENTFEKDSTILDKETNQEFFDFKIPPNVIHNLRFYPNWNENLLATLDKAKEKHYYFTFDFKLVNNESAPFSFGVQFVKRGTTYYLRPPVTIYLSTFNKNYDKPTWYTAYVLLNNQIPIKDLKFYDVQLVCKNQSTTRYSSLYLKDIEFICKDLSKVPRIHNLYLDDIVQGFTSLREFYSENLKKGKIQIWSNYILTGVEFLSEAQLGYFHPVYFLTYLLFDHFTAHIIITFICLFLCGVGAYILTRFWGLGIASSLLTGIVYMFHPFNVSWFSFEHMLMNSATLPFLILFYEKCLAYKNLLNKELLYSAFLLGLIFLSGHLQHVYYTVILFFFFVVFRLLQNAIFGRDKKWKHILSIIFVFSLGVMMSAIVLFPIFPLFQDSHRVAWPENLIKAMSVSLDAFLGLFYPYYMGYTNSLFSTKPPYGWAFPRQYVYFGLLPFLFSLFSLRILFKNKLVLFFVTSIIISLLISTGSPLFFLIKDYFPGFKQLQHNRFLQIYSYCVPFLAGIGFQVFLNWVAFPREKIKTIVICFILIFSFLDLAYYSSFFVTWANRKDYKPIHKGGVLEFLIEKQKASKEPFRVLPITTYQIGKEKINADVAKPNTLLPYKIEDASGYISFVPKNLYSLFVYVQSKDPTKIYTKEMVSLFSNTNIPYPIYNFRSTILDLLNIRYFLVPNILTLEPGSVRKVFSKDCTVYENLDYLPRAFVVSDYKVIEDPKATILYLDSNEFNPRKEVVLMTIPAKVKSKIATAVDSNIKFVEYDHSNIKLNVKVNMSGFLVLGHNLNNNWKVKINHKEGKHFQANLVQRAIYLPKAENYLIEFYYFPKLFIIGLSITCLGVFILVFLAIYLRYKNIKDLKHNKEKSYRELEKIKVNV